MTTGMPLIVTAAMKPIPTLMQPLATVNMDTLEAAQASRERSDVCAVPACAVVAEGEVAFALANAYQEAFGCTNMTDIKASIRGLQAAHPHDVAVGGSGLPAAATLRRREARAPRLDDPSPRRVRQHAPSGLPPIGRPGASRRQRFDRDAPTLLADSVSTRGKVRTKEVCMSDRYELKRPVFFVGFMGAGKTSVARRLARQCHVASVDMDTYLERREGKKVKAIFAESGEEGFRALETDVLGELAAKEPLLVSCGGGVVTREENRTILERAGFVVHLKVSADEAAGRISDTSTRPLFQNLDAARERCEERGPLYERVADATVDTAGKSVPAIAREVQNVLVKEGVLCQQRK